MSNTVTNDFNAKSNKWSEGGRSTIEWVKLIFLLLSLDSKIIKETMHILPNSSSCIDLIFTTPPNMVLQSGVHHSLHQTVTIKLYLPNFTWKYITGLLMKETFFTTPKQMPTIFNKRFIFSIGRTHYLILMLTSKCPFFLTLS